MIPLPEFPACSRRKDCAGPVVWASAAHEDLAATCAKHVTMEEAFARAGAAMREAFRVALPPLLGRSRQ